jgi:ABC-type multidrug transport system ATPase subunit/ABC-type multidrug transport system permease subunit
MQWMIEALGLTKRFPVNSSWKTLSGRSNNTGTLAVNKVDLFVGKGELFGLVGPNGAGKTTLIKMLTTLIVPSSGSARIAGFDVRDERNVKRAIALATSDERSFYWRLTGRQNLEFFSGLQNVPARIANERIDEVLSQVGLRHVAEERFHVYSTGMRQRLAIARALLTEPRVIFMDEPTKGLDPLAAGQIHKLVKEHLVDELGITVFLTSHNLPEIEKLCHRIAVMVNGTIQGYGTMLDLRRMIGSIEKYRVEVGDLEQSVALTIAENDPKIHLASAVDNYSCFEFDNDHADDRLSNLICAIQRNEGKIKTVTCAPVSLDAVFERLALRSDIPGPLEWPVNGCSMAAGAQPQNLSCVPPDATQRVNTNPPCPPLEKEGKVSPLGKGGNTSHSWKVGNASPLGQREKAGSSGNGTVLQFAELAEALVNQDLVDEATGAESRESKHRLPRLREWIVSRARTAAAIVKRDARSEFSYRFSVFMQLLEIFLTVTGLFFLSRLIGQNAINQYLAPYGGNYFSFAIIGVAFYSYFNIGFTRYAAQLGEAQTTGTLEAMLSTPAGLSTIVLGSSLWAFMVATLRVIIILVSSALLLDSGVGGGNYPLAFLILILSIGSATGFGLIAASFILVLKRGDPISWLFRSASWLLGGVVFPVAVLPPWIQKPAQLLPTTHALRAMRLALLQGKSITDVVPEIVALCLFCFILFPLSLRMLDYSVQRAKRDGSLTHY